MACSTLWRQIHLFPCQTDARLTLRLQSVSSWASVHLFEFCLARLGSLWRQLAALDVNRIRVIYGQLLIEWPTDFIIIQITY